MVASSMMIFERSRLRSAPVMLLMIGLCFSSALWAQTPSSTSDANQSWTATTDSHNQSSDPIRTVESHTQSGNRTVDKQSVQRRASDGSYVPYQDVEKETVQLDAGTIRTITRTFDHDANGGRTLVEVVEEKRSASGGDSNVVRSTSRPDGNGNLQLAQRQIEETKKISANTEDVKTTVMIPGVDGGLVPSAKTDERREQGANGTVESKKTTLLPDGAGNWQVNEVRRSTITQDGDSRSSDERVAVPDSEGKLNEVSRTISKASDVGPGEKHDAIDTYSVQMPGAVEDGNLHLVQRAVTAQHTNASGQQVTEQQTAEPNPGDPNAGLRVTTVTVDMVRPGASGAQATRTVQTRDLNGNLGVVSFDTAKSDNIHAIQVQIAPAAAPKAESKPGEPTGNTPK